MKLILYSFIGLLLPLSTAHKILVYNSKFLPSHTAFMARIADILAEAGHEVTSLMPEINPSMPNYTTKSKIVRVQKSAAATVKHETVAELKRHVFFGDNFDVMHNYRLGQFAAELCTPQCRSLLEEYGLIQQLQDEKYDVMLVEHMDVCGIGLVELIKPKAYIAVTSSRVYGSIQQQEFGIPAALSYDPAMIVSRMDVHSMWDRLRNLFADWVFSLQLRFIRNEMDSLFQEKFGDDFPTIRQISSRSAYVFVNTEPLMDFATPTISKVIYIAGIGAQSGKVNSDWEAVLTQRPRVILISFGSVAKSVDLPEDRKLGLIKTVKSFPEVTFIWKYEEDDDFARNVAGKIENLVLTKWMPQSAILNHKNLRVFVTHGGASSIHETATRGVPAIIVPLFAEQPRNAAIIDFNGLGKVLEKQELSNSTKFIEVVREVLENPNYYKNAQRIAAMLRAKPFSSKEQLIKYTEFAAEFGASAALRPQSYDMNWIEYNNADIIVVGMLIAVAMGIIARTLLWCINNRCSISAKFKKD